jgi:hypothetical protein
MSLRSTERTLIFRRPFSLSTVDGPLPAGRYRVNHRGGAARGSFVAWQRARTLLFLPADALPGKAREWFPSTPTSSTRRLPLTGWKVRTKMQKHAFVWKDWLVPPALFPLFLAAMVVAFALLRTPG